jgi:hypothetical protein
MIGGICNWHNRNHFVNHVHAARTSDFSSGFTRSGDFHAMLPDWNASAVVRLEMAILDQGNADGASCILNGNKTNHPAFRLFATHDNCSLYGHPLDSPTAATGSNDAAR